MFVFEVNGLKPNLHRAKFEHHVNIGRIFESRIQSNDVFVTERIMYANFSHNFFRVMGFCQTRLRNDFQSVNDARLNVRRFVAPREAALVLLYLLFRITTIIYYY